MNISHDTYYGQRWEKVGNISYQELGEVEKVVVLGRRILLLVGVGARRHIQQPVDLRHLHRRAVLRTMAAARGKG